MSIRTFIDKFLNSISQAKLLQKIKDYDRAIELNPKDAMAYFLRGTAYGEFGNYRKAIKDFDKTIEINPKYADTYYNRGISHHHLGNKEQALSDYKSAARLGLKTAQDFLTKQGIDW